MTIFALIWPCYNPFITILSVCIITWWRPGGKLSGLSIGKRKQYHMSVFPFAHFKLSIETTTATATSSVSKFHNSLPAFSCKMWFWLGFLDSTQMLHNKIQHLTFIEQYFSSDVSLVDFVASRDVYSSIQHPLGGFPASSWDSRKAGPQ